MASHFEMALQSVKEQDFSCPVCRDIFKHPVILSCSHTICKACLQECWKHKHIKECPVCKDVSSRDDDPPCNLALKNICEAIVGPKAAALKELLIILAGKVKVVGNVRRSCGNVIKHVHDQTQSTEGKIREQFKKLHQFLKWEEDARVAALREEKERKSKAMFEKMEGLDQDEINILNTARALGRELRAEDPSLFKAHSGDRPLFLDRPVIEGATPQNDIKEMLRLALQDPQPVPTGALIDEAEHVGNLAFRVWEKMKAVVAYTPVVLDPNTAWPGLSLSDSLTSVRVEASGRPPLLDNPERFDTMLVRGHEAFASGVHTWDVWVGDNGNWEIGVLSETCQARGNVGGAVWSLKLDGGSGEYVATSLSTAHWLTTTLRVSRPPNRVRVRLDWQAGTLSFHDPDANTHLHTFTHTFTERLSPFMHNGDSAAPLTVLPKKISVHTED